jgi:hypothetical protein
MIPCFKDLNTFTALLDELHNFNIRAGD